MKTIRGMKAFLALLGATLLAVAPARADDYPTKPIRIVVGYVPGGGTDLIARLMADGLSHRLGQQVVVENRPGATGVVGAQYVFKQAPADGYTLLAAGSDLFTVGAVRATLPYRIPEDMAFIAKEAEAGLALAVNTVIPVTSLKELVAYAKANPGKVLYASPGVGSTPHLAALLLSQQFGIQMTHVPYNGVGASVPDLLAGRVQFSPITPSVILPYVGKPNIRVIGMMANRRNRSFPDVPTMAELGYPHATATTWFGMFGPTKIPMAIQLRLQTEIAEILKDPTVRAKIENAGLDVASAPGADMRKEAVAEYEQWKAIGKANHIVVNQ